VRACSEALYLAVGNCYIPGEPHRGIRQHVLSPNCRSGACNTKLLVTLFNGGKALGSNIKLSKFYLLVDTPSADSSVLPACFVKFQVALTKSVSSTKLGVRFLTPVEWLQSVG